MTCRRLVLTAKRLTMSTCRDMTYTGFFVPYSVTFGLEDCSWNSSSAMVDFVFGWLYVVDMLINFRVGYSLEYKGSRALELTGPRAAAYYMR